jgi:hypothetical protein
MRWKRCELGRNFSLGYGGLKAGKYDCLVNNLRDGCLRSGGGDRQS